MYSWYSNSLNSGNSCISIKSWMTNLYFYLINPIWIVEKLAIVDNLRLTKLSTISRVHCTIDILCSYHKAIFNSLFLGPIPVQTWSYPNTDSLQKIVLRKYADYCLKCLAQKISMFAYITEITHFHRNALILFKNELFYCLVILENWVWPFKSIFCWKSFLNFCTYFIVNVTNLIQTRVTYKNSLKLAECNQGFE